MHTHHRTLPRTLDMFATRSPQGQECLLRGEEQPELRQPIHDAMLDSVPREAGVGHHLPKLTREVVVEGDARLILLARGRRSLASRNRNGLAGCDFLVDGRGEGGFVTCREERRSGQRHETAGSFSMWDLMCRSQRVLNHAAGSIRCQGAVVRRGHVDVVDDIAQSVRETRQRHRAS
jgi:hypothetical protein